MSSLTLAERSEVISLVRKAGDSLMAFWPGKGKKAKDTGLHVEVKKDGSLVTEADFASNKILVEGLQARFPQIGIYSEELAPQAELALREFAWIIDPLDGTKSFTEGNDDFSVLVSLCRGSEPVFGVMYFPARQQLAVGHRGEGTWLDGQRLRVSRNASVGHQRLYLRHLQLPSQEIFYPRWMDSGMAFFNVCRGEFDGIILRIVTHQEWDLAAPHIMLSEAGARITNEKGEPIIFHRAPIRYRYLIASNGLVHEQLLAMIPQEK